MASGRITGTVTTNGQYFTFYINWTSTPNTTGNYSDVTATTYYSTSNTSYAFDTVGTRECWISINGSRTTVNKRINCNPWPSGGVYEIQTATQRVQHEDNGSKTINISAYANGLASSYGPGASNASKSDVQLDNIPRASTVTAADADIGKATTITIRKASSSFTHTLSYGTGASQPSSWTNIVSKTTAGTYSWTLPTSLYSLIPNQQRYQYVWIKCDTYNGSTLLGSHTASLTATAAESDCKPTLSVAWSNTDESALTGSSGVIIRYHSTVTASITAAARNGASMREVYLLCTDGQRASPGIVQSITNPGSGTFSVTAIDSRSYSTNTTKTYTMIDYLLPTLSVSAYRPQPTSGQAALRISGAYFGGSFGAVSNTLTAQYRYKLSSSSTWSAWKSGIALSFSANTYSTNYTLPELYDYQQSYDFEVMVTDRLNSTTASSNVGRGIPVFDWGENDFQFHVPVGFASPISVASGGTGAATAAAARTNLGINFPLSVANGGTGASTASAAVTALGIRDYIVGTGTTGSWTYRKWNSGFAECWANLTTTNTNGRYVGTYPFTLTATPFMFAQRRYNGTLNTILIAQPQVASYNIYFRDGAGNVMTGTFEISLYVFGKWK